jgi:cellulose synthase operon protein C
MFKVECLGCQAPYQVDERRVPEKGLKMRCPKCGTTFKVEPPTQSTTPSQAPPPEQEIQTASPARESPFASTGLDPGRSPAKPAAGRDSLARTMIGVSSAELDLLKDASPAGNAKGFRIPRPQQPAPARPAAPAARAQPPTAPSGPPAGEIGLPETPARARGLGEAAAARDAALPEVVRQPRRGAGAAAGEAPTAQPSLAPPSGGWIASEEVSDAPPDSLSRAGEALSLSDLPQPVVAPPRAVSDVPKLPTMAEPRPLELEFEEDLPIVATPQKRPPPRRQRLAQTDATGDDGADLPARLDAPGLGLPVAVTPPARPIDRAPRPPSRNKPPGADLDLPAVAGRGVSPPAPAAPSPAAPSPVSVHSKETLVDLPSARARGPLTSPTETDLPAVGKANRRQKGPAEAGLPNIARGPRPVTARPPSVHDDDLPDVLSGSAVVAMPKAAPELIGLPEVLSTGLPAVPFSGAPGPAPGRAVPRVAPQRLDADLPDVLGGHAPPPAGLPEVRAPGLPAVSDSGLPEVFGTGLPEVRASGLPEVRAPSLPEAFGMGLPEVRASGLPELQGTGLPAVSAAGLPQVANTGLPDVLAAGLPEVSGAGLPDVLAAGLPNVAPVGLPEVFAPGVSGFGRVDLPVHRPAELPEVRAAGIGEVDLPGIGEVLPSVAGEFGGNLPTVGEVLPMAKSAGEGGPHYEDADSPFDAFGDPGEGDPFAGSEAEFGALGDDPFAAPAAAPAAHGGEFAPEQGEYDGGEPADAAEGPGYGEVDIGGELADASLETADDMEFQGIPQRSASPARAAASASVHADGPDADAAGSTLELGPERKAPKARQRRLLAAAALALATIAGGALALEPAIGPFGVHLVIDQIKRGDHERQLAKLIGAAREASQRDTLAAAQPELQEVEAARAAAPRFAPFSARSAIDHYKTALRFGPLPDLEATGKVAVDQLEPDSDEPIERLARAARSAAARSDDAKAQLEALGNDPDAQELLGELLLRKGDFGAALTSWTELANAQPTNARALFGLARAALGLGQPAEALRHAQQVSTLSPGHVGAPIVMLEARRALRKGVDAGEAPLTSTEDLAAAVRNVLAMASPGEAALAHCVLGELHASQGRAGPAQQEFEAALVVDRTLVRALTGLGEVLHQVGRDSEALARFAAAAQAEPEHLGARLGIAKSQIRLAQLADAKKTLAELAASHPNHPEIIFWQGKAAQAVGDHDAALAAYRAAIVAAKGLASSVEAYLALAKLQAELGQLAVAQGTLSEARDKLPPSGPLYHALGEVAMSRADYGSAYEQFQKALDLDAGDTRARFLGAVALTRLGRFDEALAAFTSVGQTDKDFPGLAVERGRLFEESGRNAEALTEYEAALAKTPEDPEVQIRVGCARMVSGKTTSAQEVLEKVAKVRPRSAEANYCLGRALSDQERYLEAMVRLERAVNIDPTRAIYHLYVGWVAGELGRQTNALAALDDAIELDKGLADAYWQRGRLRLKQGAARDAIVDLERARSLKPSRHDALADLAVAYSDIGRMPKALALWEEAIANDADNPTWHFRYGKMLSSAGNGALAAAHIKRAIELATEAQAATPSGTKPKAPLWLWQAHYLLARELGLVPAAIPQWQAYLRLAPHDDPYRAEAERALRQLGQPWQEK